MPSKMVGPMPYDVEDGGAPSFQEPRFTDRIPLFDTPSKASFLRSRCILLFLKIYLSTSIHLPDYCYTLDTKCYSFVWHTCLLWARQQLKPCCSLICRWTKRLMPNSRCSQAAAPLNIRFASEGRMTQFAMHARPSTRVGSTLARSICSSGTSTARTTRPMIH